MTIIHTIRDPNNYNILLTCPVCLKSLVKQDEEKRIEDMGKKLLTYEDTKKQIENDFINNEEKSYEMWCPHCHRFNIIYKNEMQYIKDAEKTNNEVIDYEGTKKIETNRETNNVIEGTIEEC